MTSLGDKIAELLDPAPKLKDKDEDFGIEACVDKYKPDYGDAEAMDRSQLRIQNFQPCSDKRYIGKKVSRRKLMKDSDNSDSDMSMGSAECEEDKDDSKEDYSDFSEESEESCDEDEDGDELDLDEDRNTIDTSKCYNSMAHTNVGSDYSENSDDENGEEENSDLDDETEDSMIEKFSSIDVDEEVQKGKAVKAQLSLWDRIVENRIKLQKLLVLSNKLPQNDDYKHFIGRGNEEFRELVNKGHKSVKLILDLLIELQTELLWRNNNTNYIISNKDNAKKESSDEEIPSETEDDDDDSQPKGKLKAMTHGLKRKLTAEEYPDFLAKRHKSFMPFRNGTIQKWNDKVKISSGKFTQNSFSAFDQSALKQIEQILSDKPRLIRKTQVKRSTYRILGKSEGFKGLSDSSKEVLQTQNHHEKEYDAEIFDDDDFYHQLLRELIEKKIDINDPVALSRQWLEIQKLRKKMKKNVDTKASKGRKVRYDVIPKLVNFMASVDCSKTAEETVNELCRSLFKDSHQADHNT